MNEWPFDHLPEIHCSQRAMKKKSVAAAMKSTGVRRSLRSRNSSSAPQTPFLKRRKTEDVKSPFFNQSSSKAGATKKDQAESLEVALYDGSNEDPEDPVSELHDGLSDIEEELLKNRPSRNQTRVAVSSDDDDSESSFQENAATEEDTSSGESDIDDNVSDSSVVSEAPAPRKKVSRAQPRRLNDSPVPVLQGVSTTDSATDPVNTASLEIAIETPALDAEIVSQEPGAPATATGRQRGRRRAPKKKKDPVKIL